MVENPKRHGRGSSYSIESSQRICTYSENLVIVYSGDEISTVLIMRSIWLAPKRMMEKYDSIHSRDLGSIVVTEKIGMISGEKKTRIHLKSTHGGIL